MRVACFKLKVAFPNIAIRGVPGTTAVSRMELFVATAL